MRTRLAALTLVLLIAGACDHSRKPAVVALPNGDGSLIGGIVTADGNALPGATVTLVMPDGNGTRVAVTDANGQYHFVKLGAGAYAIRAELAGRPVTRVAHVGAPATYAVDFDLRASGVSEAITVTSASPAMMSGTWSAPPPPARAERRQKSASPAPQPNSVSAATVESMPIARTFLPAPALGQGVTGGVAGGVPQVYEPPHAEEYSSFEDHGFVKAAAESTTTFAIDVDRASYANVRRFLRGNQLPPRDAVRVEEMVNYFTYAYPQPTGADPFAVTADVASCPWAPDHRLLRIGIQGRNLDEWKMAPNNLVFLLDVSGSMATPDKLPLIKSAFEMLVDKLRPEDRVSIVVYAGTEGLALPSTSGADKATIRAALQQLGAGGSTAGGAGITLAYKVARDNFIQGGNNRVILATDGDFNVGISSISDLEKLIEEKRKDGIFLTTIGVGSGNYRDSVLETLADKGNGNYSYLDTIDEARKVFGSELTGTLVAIAKDVKVQLEFDPNRVAEYRQIGYENRALENQDFADDTKDAGELGAGHSVTALYEIIPTSNARGPVATLRLRYKKPDGDKSSLIVTNAIDDGSTIWQTSPDFQFAAAVAEFGMLLRNSPHKGNATYADVLAMAKASRGIDPLREEFSRLVDTANVKSGGSGTTGVATMPVKD